MRAKKPEQRARARALKEAHPEMTTTEIAREIGESASTVHKWLNPEKVAAWNAANDPDRIRRRAWDQDPRNHLPCVDCGGASSGLKGQSVRRCWECHARAMNDDRNRRWARIQELWHEGRTVREIAKAIGSTPGSTGVMIVRMRADGWDMPRRHNWSEESLRAVRAARLKAKAA